MKRDAALAIIQRHEAELKELGIVSLSLFGSTARNDATHRSDIDVAVQLEEMASGFATIGQLDRIKQRLRELLDTSVDVVPEPLEPGRLKAAIDKDRCLAF